MSTEVPVEAQLNQMERVEPETPPQDTPPPEPELNLADDAAVDAALDANAIQVPDGDKLVPSSDVGKVARHYRTELKETRAKLAEAERGSAEAATLRQQIQQLQQHVQQLTPYVQAYQQAVQQPAQTTPVAPEVSDEEAKEYASDLDLYKADGSGQLDIDRGRKVAMKMRRVAKEAGEQAAQAQVAPIHQMTEAQLSRHNFGRALHTTLPNGMRASEATLKAVWQQLPPSVTATVEGAQEALLAAIGRTAAMLSPQEMAAHTAPQGQRQRGPNGQFLSQPQQQATPEAVPREPSGGKDVQGQSPLSEQEKKFLSATGMSEADYLKTASSRFGAR